MSEKEMAVGKTTTKQRMFYCTFYMKNCDLVLSCDMPESIVQSNISWWITTYKKVVIEDRNHELYN